MIANSAAAPLRSTSARAAALTGCEGRRTALCAAALSVALGASSPALADEPAPSGTMAVVPAAPAGTSPAPITAPPPPPPYDWYAGPYAYAPGAVPVWSYPPPVNPVAVAYMNEHDEETAREAGKRARKKLPESVTSTPEYKAARDRKIAGIVTVSVSGAAMFGGLMAVVFGGIKSAFSGSNSGDQAVVAGGVTMGVGALGLVVGGVTLASARSELTKIQDDHVRRTLPSFTVDVGAGSVSVSTSF